MSCSAADRRRARRQRIPASTWQGFLAAARRRNISDRLRARRPALRSRQLRSPRARSVKTVSQRSSTVRRSLGFGGRGLDQQGPACHRLSRWLSPPLVPSTSPGLQHCVPGRLWHDDHESVTAARRDDITADPAEQILSIRSYLRQPPGVAHDRAQVVGRLPHWHGICSVGA
jgi:hypothetical protein